MFLCNISTHDAYGDHGKYLVYDHIDVHVMK